MNQQTANEQVTAAFPRPPSAGPVVILGAGLVGLPTGLVFALAGYQVRLVETDPPRCDSVPSRLTDLLDFLVTHGLVEHATAHMAMPRIAVSDTLEDVLSPAGVTPAALIEAVFEDLELKRSVLAAAERSLSPEVVMCSVTSGLSITALSGGLQHPERFCGAHFWNPPHLIPLVEVIYGARTADRTVAALCTMLEYVGKRPVVVRRDVPGFIGNRLLHALQKEAMAVVASGVASAADVDLVVTQGFGRRLGVVGPLAVCDLAGLDLVLDVDAYLIRDLDRSADPSPLLTSLVEQGKLGVKTLEGFYQWTQEEVAGTIARRDAALIRALRADRAEQAQPAESSH